MKVGTVLKAKSNHITSTVPIKAGAIGVVYHIEKSNLVHIIFGNGETDKSSFYSVCLYYEIIGKAMSSLAENYHFSNTHQLKKDFALGYWKSIFKWREIMPNGWFSKLLRKMKI